MEVPQANERVKEAPAHALRAMFAGIGRLLSVTDKIRNRPGSAGAPAGAETVAPETVAPETVATVAPETVAPETITPETVAAATAAPETATPETTAPETTAPETATPETATPEAQLDAPVAASGHVKVLPAEPTPAAPAAAAEVAPTAAEATAAAEAPAAAEATAAAEAPAAELPLPNYDDLSIASLRARLRNLSAQQLRQLIEYEKGHADRADVITMFERRIAKLAEG
jgi:hypothetical protein